MGPLKSDPKLFKLSFRQNEVTLNFLVIQKCRCRLIIPRPVDVRVWRIKRDYTHPSDVSLLFQSQIGPYFPLRGIPPVKDESEIRERFAAFCGGSSCLRECWTVDSEAKRGRVCHLYLLSCPPATIVLPCHSPVCLDAPRTWILLGFKEEETSTDTNPYPEISPCISSSV